jgi:hypothetical protein
LPDLEEALIQEFLDNHAAELNVEDHEQQTMLKEPENAEDSEAVVGRPALTISALKKGL